MVRRTSLIRRLIRWFGERYRLGPALDFLGSLERIGQPSEVTLPTELLPMGARMLARSLLTAQVVQANMDWIWPFWVVQQYDPASAGFIPRAFQFISPNSTHRNWTAIGCLNSERESVVDPRGLVTPWHDGWSADFWIQKEGEVSSPSRLDAVSQGLVDNLPVVETRWETKDITITSRSFSTRIKETEVVLMRLLVEARGKEASTRVIASLRPYNPEVLSLIHSLEYIPDKRLWMVNGSAALLTMETPDSASTSDYRRGDVSLHLNREDKKLKAHCPAGLATGECSYDISLKKGDLFPLHFIAPVREGIKAQDATYLTENFNYTRAFEDAVALFEERIGRGMEISLPDKALEDSFRANLAYIHLLDDGDYICPGPLTYHRYWFRDSAYLINCLDKLGYPDQARRKLLRYPERQEKDGYFRSQKGEWDSNGQAIWPVFEHYRLHDDSDLIETLYPSISLGAGWIEKKRSLTKDRPSVHHGLLPPGFSAEHFGPNDYFYWDDFWGIAGLREAIAAAEILGKEKDVDTFGRYLRSFKRDLEVSLKSVEERLGEPIIPASPYRRMDSGAIGSVVALYPLRILDPFDPRIVNTIRFLREECFYDGAFFQNLIHSGLNCYLTCHIIQCLIYQKSGEVWPMIRRLLDLATPTFTWPEAIHPITKGGCMGDGHHGWAAADWLLMIRNLLFFEEGEDLVITPALPEEWFENAGEIKVRQAPTYFGELAFEMKLQKNTATLSLYPKWRKRPARIRWHLPCKNISPLEKEKARIEDGAVIFSPDIKELTVIWGES